MAEGTPRQGSARTHLQAMQRVIAAPFTYTFTTTED
jgi:hypothetical protein